MANPLSLKTNGAGGRGGGRQKIEQDTKTISSQSTRMTGLRWIA